MMKTGLKRRTSLITYSNVLFYYLNLMQLDRLFVLVSCVSITHERNWASDNDAKKMQSPA